MAAPTPRGGAAGGGGAPSSFSFGAALASLPEQALIAVLLHLPLDDRLRCAEVCRSWRAMLAERSLWMHLDLASASHPCDGLLRAAAARALRNVRSLDVSGVLHPAGRVSLEALCAVVAQNVGLSVLHARGCGARGGLPMPTLRCLLQAAPRLRELHADVSADAEEALEIVRSAAPFAPLRVRRLCLRTSNHLPLHHLNWMGYIETSFFNPPPAWFQAAASPAGVPMLELLQDVLPAHPARCAGLALTFTEDHAPLVASAEAAIAAKLTSLSWRGARAGGVALLTRVLQENAALTQLDASALHLDCAAEAQAPSRVALNGLCNALRSSRLTALTLRDVGGSGRSPENAEAVFCALAAALAGHPTLQQLRLCLPLRPKLHMAHAPHPGVDAALASLLTVPSLTSLELSGCCFMDEELALLAAALPQAPKLRVLDLRGSQLRTAFVRDVLAPAVQAAAHGQALTELRLHQVVGNLDRPLPVFAADEKLRGLERAAAAAAAVRGQRFIFRAEHEALCHTLLCDEATSPLLHALKNSKAMTRCVLGGPFASAAKRLSPMWGAEVLRALVGHPTLEALTLEGDLHALAPMLGGVLGRIVAADAPLQSLRCAGCGLGDEGLGWLVEALPRNTRLRRLECSGNKLTAAFAREVLLPAVQENAGLEHLSAADVLYMSGAATAAMALVNARGARACGVPNTH